jgi:hypothetical protein
MGSTQETQLLNHGRNGTTKVSLGIFIFPVSLQATTLTVVILAVGKISRDTSAYYCTRLFTLHHRDRVAVNVDVR